MAPACLVVFGLLLLALLPSFVPAQTDAIDESYFLLSNFPSVSVLNQRGDVQNEFRNAQSHQVDFDPITSRLFWPDYEEKSINAAFLNGSQRTVLRQLPTGSTPVGIAVDHILHLVFYSDNSRQVIGVMDTDGRSHRIVRSQGLSYPWALAVDVIHERLYYTEDRNTGNIGRMAYDGSSYEVLYRSLPLPRGLALDVRGGRMYWSTFGDGRIESARLDGTDRTLVRQDQNNQLGLALFDGVLYFTLRYITSIFSVTVRGANRQEMATGAISSGFYDITVFSKSQAITIEEKEGTLRPSGTPSTATPRTRATTPPTPRTVATTTPTPRTVATTPPTPRTVATTTRIPRTVATTTPSSSTVGTPSTTTPGSNNASDETYFLLTNMNNITILNVRGEVQHELPDTYSHQVDCDATTGRIFWPDRYRQTINTAVLNGDQRVVFRQLPSGSDPVGVAVDHTEQLVFYSAYSAHLIGVMNTGGGSHRVLRDQGLTRPWALAVDVIHKFLYYTEGQDPGNIGRLDYKGSNHEVIHSCERMPVGIALDVRGGRMYWSTLLDGRIHSSGLDGTGRTIVHQELFYQYGLAFSDGVIYFTNNGIRSILSVTANGTNRQEVAVNVATTYFDIVVCSKSHAVMLWERMAAREAGSSATPGSK